MPPLTPQSLRVAGKALGFTDEAGEAIRQLSKPIRAYHGSPHSFDAFDASKIGTGEGAQSYGHGLYFAGNEAVAQQYRRQLAGPPEPMDLAIDGVPVFRKAWERLPPLHKDGTNYLYSRLGNYAPEHAEEAIQMIRGDLPRLLQDAEGNVDALEKFALERRLSELRGAMDLLDNSRLSVLPPTRPGSTYEVEIGHPEEALLDWDATLAGQPAAVRESLARFRSDKYDLNPRYGTDQETGATALHRIAHGLGTDMPGASGALLRAGIPGIRYLDGMSRSAGEGTRNYVMFPGTEDKIRILRKYGLLLPAAAAGTNSEE